MNEELMKQHDFSAEIDLIKQHKCPFCRTEKLSTEDFRDDLSRKEFAISHLYQACQDSIWPPTEEDKDICADCLYTDKCEALDTWAIFEQKALCREEGCHTFKTMEEWILKACDEKEDK
jgi:hypothetical protein